MRELVYWSNQYGNGIVIKGKLAEDIKLSADLVNETPEEFVMRAIKDAVREG